MVFPPGSGRTVCPVLHHRNPHTIPTQWAVPPSDRAERPTTATDHRAVDVADDTTLRSVLNPDGGSSERCAVRPLSSRTIPTALSCLLALILVGCAAAPAGPGPVQVADPGPGETVQLRWLGAEPPSSHSYGEDPRQVLDVYPVDGGGRGTIVVVHGGGFTTGDKLEAQQYFGLLGAQRLRGFGIVSVDYRLTTWTANAFPTAVTDVSNAIDWIRAHAASLGLNTSTLVVAGVSAGATISALIGTAGNDLAPGPLGSVARVDGWIGFAGAYDFRDDRWARVSIASLRDQWLGWNRADVRFVEAASAVMHLDRGDAPGYVAHGDNDSIVPIRQLDLLVDAARLSGVTTTLHVDRVDTGGVDLSTGAAVPCRWHLPMCGTNATALGAWLDSLARTPS